MTIKSRTFTKSFNRIYRKYDKSTGQPNESYPIRKTLTYENMTNGDDVPGYKNKIRHGESATSNFSGTEFTIDHEVGTLTFPLRDSLGNTWKESIEDPISDWSDFIFGPKPVSSSNKAEHLASGSLFNSISDARSAFKGMTALAELTEILTLVSFRSSSILKLFKKYDDVVKKLPSRATKRQRLADLSSAYLESVFGWAPLFNDIEDLGKAVKRISSKMPTIRVHGFGTETLASVVVSEQTTDTSSNLLVQKDIRRSATQEVIFTGGLILPKSAYNVPSALGFRPEEFVPTLVEILPFSFLLDYFSNFSQVVTAHSEAQPEFSYMCRTERLINERVYSVRALRAKNDFGGPATGQQKATLRGKWIDRKPQSSVSKPDFVVRNPMPKQILNMAALVSALTTRRF